MDLTAIPLFPMTGLLALMRVAPLLPGRMPDYRDLRESLPPKSPDFDRE